MIQQTALEQLSQAYAKGKPDMMEWRALQTAMPAQLQQIAKAMNTTTAALGEDLRSGKVSMNDFMKTIVQLNKEGIDGFQNFEEQARNATGGIKTSMANMKSAITRGVANIIENINKGLEANNLPNISKIISKTGKEIEKVLNSTGKGLQIVIKFLKPFFNLAKSTFNFFKDNWSKIAPIILAVAAAYGVLKLAQLGYTTALTIGKAIQAFDIFQLGVRVAALNLQSGATFGATAAQYGLNAALLACPLTWIIGLIILLATAFILLWDNCEGFRNFFTDMLIEQEKGLARIYNNFVVPVANGVINALNLINEAQHNFWANTINGFATMATGVVDSISGILNMLKLMISSYNLVSSAFGGKTINTDIVSPESIKSGINSAKNIASNINDALYGMKYKNLKTLDLEKWDKSADILGSKIKDFKFSEAFKSITGDLTGGTSEIDELLSGLNSLVDTDSTGGKALKVTSDDNLLSDEDIQLLLDVATRDYKLNYQQVTPNITLTFGDIRETADVDDILEQVADKLEEIYDGNLEV